MKKVKKMALGGMGSKRMANPFRSMGTPNSAPPPAMGRVGTPNFPQGAKDFVASKTGLKPIQQDYQALFDKNMAQAQALPPEARSQFSQQFQRAAAAGDPSTIRPGTTFGTPGGLIPIRAGLMKKGGAVKAYAKGGAVKSSASKRADGCAVRGKTKGKMI